MDVCTNVATSKQPATCMYCQTEDLLACMTLHSHICLYNMLPFDAQLPKPTCVSLQFVACKQAM